ncbi:DNA integrity scanning protein DisA [Candidatus Pacearchaeota archaeon]|nr:DNA integrity scanning protein DisA [Candidatus Pacearchaeota archaeon]
MEEEKKEIQRTIIPLVNTVGKASEEEFFSILKTVAPGTNLRAAIDSTIKASKGALIVIANDHILSLIDGGFRVNCRFTPQRLMELTKMDGAIILSNDIKRIEYANVLLTPDSKISTSETGTRHKAAERTAKQTGCLVIAISERRHDSTVYYKNIRHTLKGTDIILRKANEYIQLLEKQRDSYDDHVTKLNKLELKNYPSLGGAVHVIQKGKMIQKITEDLKKFIMELGSEGTLLKARLRELNIGVEKETLLVIKDYTRLDVKKSKILLDELSYDDLLDVDCILHTLAYDNLVQIEPIKGWRMLSKTSLQESDIAKLIKEKNSLGEAIYSNVKTYFEIIGEDKAKTFKEEIEKIKMNP